MLKQSPFSSLWIAIIIVVISITVGGYWIFKKEEIEPIVKTNFIVKPIIHDSVSKKIIIDSASKISDSTRLKLLKKVLALEAMHITKAKDYTDLAIVVNNMSIESPNFEYVPGIIPLKPGTYRRISSHFGMRFHPIRKVNKMHFGMDVSANIGTPVYATASGYVEIASAHQAGYGNMVKVHHPFGFQTIYGHLKTFVCNKGQQITRGQLLGYVGSTGLSTGPHLHYEIVKNGLRIDPIEFVEFAKKIFLNDYL
jgi:murein DD-endopeptidase MepM/ murein hydrolase activator NlpD